MKAIFLCTVSLWFYASGHLGAQPSCRPTVPVIAFDQKTAAPIAPLAVSDIRAEFKGSELRVRALTAPATRRLVFVLDRSGSISAHRRNPFDFGFDAETFANRSLSEAIAAIPNRDAVAFLAFAGHCSRRTEFMPSGSAKAKLADIFAWTPESKCGLKTSLWDNVGSALKMFDTPAPGDTIIVISDGDDNMSGLSPSQLRNELIAAGVPVLAILVVRPDAPSPGERFGPGNLADLAETTGGTFALTGKPPQDVRLVGRSLLSTTQLLSLLAHQYDVTLELPQFSKPEKWQLTVKTAYAGKKARLLYPAYLYPCAPVR